ncbi:MAG: DNA primase [Clostridium sp.]|nr:DNA primase [Clostridium sp.]MCM1548243.1 DNA primase [Ruminococcus sp.]
MPLPEEFLYQLKLTNSIDSVVGGYVNLKRSGHDFVALCPFHSEKTPSFHVYTDTQSFYCFGCGAGGDVITFIKQIENLDYIEAVRLLAQRGGIEVPESREDIRASELKKRIYEINRETANYYYRQLVSGQDKNGLKYFASRGLRPETIKKYGLGYAPPGWDFLRKHLLEKGYKDDEMIAAGVRSVSRNETNVYDTFRNRVIFPIIDLRGNVIAFGGRVLDDSLPKYLNTSDTPVFKKSRNLFSLNFAKNSPLKQLILAEGYMDVIAINQAGFENVVATLGTAITPEQARIMKSYADEVIISYDSDGAGQKATQKAINLLSEAGVATKIIKMEGAKDPDEYIKKFGAKRFKMLLDNSDGAVNFELQKCKNGIDIDSDTGQVEFRKRIVDVLAQIANELERDFYVSKTAKENEINIDVLRSQVDNAVRKGRYIEKKKEWQAIRSQPFFSDPLVPEKSAAPKEVKAEETIIAFIFRHPDYAETVRNKLSPENFITDFYRRIFVRYCERISENQSFSLSMFSDVFNEKEMGKIAGIEAKYREITITERSLNDCIKILLDYQNDPLNKKEYQLSDDDLLNIVKAKR